MKNQYSIFLNGIKTLEGKTAERDDTVLSYEHLNKNNTKSGREKVLTAIQKDSKQLKRLDLKHKIVKSTTTGINKYYDEAHILLIITPNYIKYMNERGLQMLIDATIY